MDKPRQTPAAIDIILAAEDSGTRLDLFITRHIPQTSRSQVQKLIAEGAVTVNGVTVQKRLQLAAGDRIHVDLAIAHERAHPQVKGEDIPLDILHEDDAIVVVNKPAGLVVHPGNGNREGTLVNALLFHAGELAGGSAADRPGIVHRLDKDTSGVMVAVKTAAAHTGLAAQFSAHTVDKKYIGVCIGQPPAPSGLMDYPLARSNRDPMRRTVMADGKEAKTEYTVLASRSGICVVQFTLFTGRTHQIRAHCAHTHIPIVADDLYGGGKERLLQLQPLDRAFAYGVHKCFARHALHSHVLGFKHPVSGKKMSFIAPFPADFKAALACFPDLPEFAEANKTKRGKKR